MWIRSQDKEILANIKAVTLEPSNKIFGWVSGDFYFKIAQYDTKKEATKVLDMIQNKIYNIDYCRFLGCENVEHESPIFQIPPKNFGDDTERLRYNDRRDNR
jgi:hypothetical protein